MDMEVSAVFYGGYQDEPIDLNVHHRRQDVIYYFTWFPTGDYLKKLHNLNWKAPFDC